MSEPNSVDSASTTWSLNGPGGVRELGPHLVPKNPDEFVSRGRRWVLSGVTVADAAQTPMRIAPSGVDPLQREYVSVVFVRNGSYNLFGDRTYHFDAGQAGHMIGWDQVAAENPETSRVAMVTMHRDRLAVHGVKVRDNIGGFSDAGRLKRPSLSFLLALMDELATAGSDAPVEPMSTVLTQLMAGLFIEDAGYRMDSVSFTEGLRARAEALIARYSGDPDFTPQALAERLNVSLRHLQRGFSAVGSGPAESIRARRLESAVNSLRPDSVGTGSVGTGSVRTGSAQTGTMQAGSSARRSVAEIALQAGFSSVKELRYALRTTYGVTPRELLAGRPLVLGSDDRLTSG